MKSSIKKAALSFLLPGILSLPVLLTAQWSVNPAANNLVSGYSSYAQTSPASVTDGSDGAIVIWVESGGFVYAQRVEASGKLSWTTAGILVASAYGGSPVIMSDGSGGAIIVWSVRRYEATDIFAQRINGSGELLWGPSGKEVCLAANDQANPAIVSDGAGGAFVSWTDYRNGELNADIYAQRLDTAGNAQWATDGIPISTASSYQMEPAICATRDSCAIIVWLDCRADKGDIYAQKINFSGTALFTPNGSPVCTVSSEHSRRAITSDGNNGAILAWEDSRNGFLDIYAQRIGSSGSLLWAADGVPVCTSPGHQQTVALVADNAGGAVAAWYSYLSGEAEIYAQRLDNAGNGLWALNGVAVCSTSGIQEQPAIALSSDNGFIIAWRDGRVAKPDIYAQQLDLAGNPRWQANGVGVCTAGGEQAFPIVVPDELGGAVIVWQDVRATSHIYASYVDSMGTLGKSISPLDRGTKEAPSGLGLTIGSPNPFNTSAAIRFSLPNASNAALTISDLRGREVARLLNGSAAAGSTVVQWNPGALPRGIYICTLKACNTRQAIKLFLE